MSGLSPSTGGRGVKKGPAQRGVLAGVSMKHVKLTAYFFNPDEDKPSFVFAVGVPF